MASDFPGLDEAGYQRQTDNATPGQQFTLLDELIEDTTDPNKIVTKAPTEHFRLGYLDVTCLVINRMIEGTGIFNSPQTVIVGTGSTGVSLLFWFAGIIYCLAGVHVYVEYGLNVPRYIIDGIEQSVPRSGGDLHYLQYIFSKPRYARDTVLLMGCLFGISFICIGNMAGNCIICGLRLLQAARPDQPVKSFASGEIRGIAIGIATFACFIHAFSRRGGIWLNNVLALVKVGILLLIIATACAVAGGALHRVSDGTPVPDVFRNNTVTTAAFAEASDEAIGYAQAFLFIIFAFSGFDQPNYVLGEIQRPRKTFPLSMFVGVGSVSILYMAVNLCYMTVVPAASQKNLDAGSVAQQFFDMTFGVLSEDPTFTGKRIFNAFLAISSFGNIVVMTYTAARMKQEIAKQGFLPWPKFFAQNQDFSLGRLLRWLDRHGVRIPFLSPEQHSEKTPVGALVLHFLSCLVLIFATYAMSPDYAYKLLSGLIAYLMTAWFGFFLALGILILRFRGPPRTDPVATPRHPKVRSQQPVETSWSAMTKGTVRPWLSITAAFLYLIGNAYPIIANWVPPSDRFGAHSLTWYLTPLVCWCVLGLSTLWFLGFLARAKFQKRDKEFVLVRSPEFDWAENEDAQVGGGERGNRVGKHGGLILVHETVTLSWPGTEMGQLEQLAEDETDKNPFATAYPQGDELAGTDFDTMGNVAASEVHRRY